MPPALPLRSISLPDGAQVAEPCFALEVASQKVGVVTLRCGGRLTGRVVVRGVFLILALFSVLTGASLELKAQASAAASATVEVSPAQRRKQQALAQIYREAAAAKDGSAERGKLQDEFLARSAEYVAELPDAASVWVLRAAICLERDRAREGWEAGRALVRLGLENSADPAVQQLLVQLERKNWLGEKPPAAVAAALSEDDRLEMGTLVRLTQEAAGQSAPAAIRTALAAVLKRSVALAQRAPDHLPVWQLRAHLALELDQSNFGWLAAKQIKRLAPTPPDPKLSDLLVRLNARGWLGESSPFEGRPVVLADLALELRPIPAGSFLMGSPADEPGRRADEVQHRVNLTQPFWLGKTEVTVAQWRAVMGTSLQDQVRKVLNDDTLYNLGGKRQTVRDYWNVTRTSDPGIQLGATDDDGPMIFVSWDDAMEFCRRLTDREREAGRLPEGYRYTLPTEAQWEYACRAGTTGAVYVDGFAILGKHHAPALDAIAWYGGNSSVGYKGKGWDTTNWLEEKQYPGGVASYRIVGQKRANAWGLHDMIGNVWEWCSDWYGRYPAAAVSDSKGPASGTDRVYRGGSWRDSAGFCRSANRNRDGPGNRNNGLGFRLALSSGP